MKNIYVKDIIEKCSGKLIYGNLNETLDNFSKDTRNIRENDIYIGIKGANFDGNLFYEDAFNKGAKVCIIENKSINLDKIKLYNNKTLVTVDDSIKTLQILAEYKRSLYDIPVIAVTGSVGKTSTRDIIDSVLSQNYNVLKTEGNYNNNIGMPLTILKLKNHTAMVLEMGMNNLGEIELLSNIAKPTIGVITNVGTAHIGNLGSRENILKAKLEIISGFNKDSILIINNDNDLLSNSLKELKDKVNIITIGINKNSNFNANYIEDNVFSSKFSINNSIINLKVGGKAFIYNALMAFSIGKLLNIDDNKIVCGLENFKLTENRLEKIISKSGITIINDTYNASFDSVKNAIELLGKSKYERKILLFGDILELGDFTEEIHRNIGNEIINSNINVVITVGEFSKYTVSEIKEKGFNINNIYQFNKEDETYDFLKEFLTNRDIILIKGSHSMNLINIVSTIKNY